MRSPPRRGRRAQARFCLRRRDPRTGSRRSPCLVATQQLHREAAARQPRQSWPATACLRCCDSSVGDSACPALAPRRGHPRCNTSAAHSMAKIRWARPGLPAGCATRLSMPIPRLPPRARFFLPRLMCLDRSACSRCLQACRRVGCASVACDFLRTAIEPPGPVQMRVSGRADESGREFLLSYP